jgi:GAF domain-containing protein
VALDRLLVILEMLARSEEHGDHPAALCSIAADVTKLDGAGITLCSSGPNYTRYCASDDVVRQLLDTEVQMGVGPGVDACRSNVSFDSEDLLSIDTRWMAYAPAAVALGVRAVFSFPVGIGGARIGALILYRTTPGPLDEQQISDAYLMASVVGRAVLATRAGASRADLTGELALALSFDFSVHQAAGMVAVQGKMSLGDAMVALRAHAFGSGASMTSVAESVVRRETTFEGATRTWQKK